MPRKLFLLTCVFAIIAAIFLPYESFAREGSALKIRISIVMVKEESKAEEILNKLRGGEDFVILAKKYSLVPIDVGYFSKGDLIPELDEVAFRLKGGEFSPIIKSSKGFFIIKRTDVVEDVQKKKEEAPLPKVKPDELYQSALQHFRYKNLASALDSFKKFLTNFPDHELAGNVHYHIGEIYYEELPKEAIKEFDEVIKKYPKSEKVPAAVLMKGLYFYKLGNKEEAKTLLEKVIDIYPDSDEASVAKEKLKILVFQSPIEEPGEKIPDQMSKPALKEKQEKGKSKDTNITLDAKKAGSIEKPMEKMRELAGRNDEFMAHVEKGDALAVNSFLATGVDPNVKDKKSGRTVLMIAAFNDYTYIVRALLEKGADVIAKDNNGRTALMYAAQNGRTDTVRVLLNRGAMVVLEKGADINMKDKDGKTALMYAAQNGHAEIIRVLLSRGADVHVKANDGWTASMFASEKGHTEIVLLLMLQEMGINIGEQTSLSLLLFVGILVIVLALALAIITFFYCLKYLKKRGSDYKRMLRIAEVALEKGKIERAKKYYERVIQSSPSEAKEILGKAYLGLGKVFEARKDIQAAFENYKKAKKSGAPLHNNAIILMGHCYAETAAKDEEAIDIYLIYIKLKPLEKGSAKIYSIMENICYIDETKESLDRKRAMVINRKVVTANPNVEWAYYYLGLGYILEGNLSKGRTSLTNALNLNPNRPLTYYWLAKICLHQPDVDPDKVLKTCTKFLTFIPEDINTAKKQGEAAFELGKLLINQLGGFETNVDLTLTENKDKLIQAISYLEKAVTKDENNAEYLFYLGMAYSLNKASSEAIKTFKKVITLSPNNKEYLYYLAIEYKSINSLKDAKDSLKKALEMDSEYAEAHGLLSEVCLINREYGEAEKHCRIWINLKGYDYQNILKLIQALYHQGKFGEVIEEVEKSPASFTYKFNDAPEAAFCIARSYSLTGNFDMAISWFKGLPEGPRNLYYFGCALANKGAYEETLSWFDKVIGQESEYRGKAFLQRGHIFLKTGKVKEAEENYKKACDIDPGNPELISALGCFYCNSGDMEKAFSYFSKALEMDSNDSLAHFGMGLIREKHGEIFEAMRDYELALKDRGVSLPARIRLGILYCRRSDYQMALEHLEQVRQSGNESDSLLFYLGMALLFCKQTDKALEVWNKLHSRHPGDERLGLNVYRAHYLLGSQYINENKYNEAIAEWEEYLKKYREDEKTRKDLAELYFRAGIAELMNEKSGDINKAKIKFQKAIEFDNNNHTYCYYNGLCDFGLGNYTECITQLNRILDSQLDNPRIKYHIGLSLLRKGEKEKALEVLNGLANGENKDTYANYAAWVVANQHIKKGHYSEGAKILASMI